MRRRKSSQRNGQKNQENVERFLPENVGEKMGRTFFLKIVL